MIGVYYEFDEVFVYGIYFGVENDFVVVDEY